MLNIFAAALFQIATITTTVAPQSAPAQDPGTPTSTIGSGGWGGDIIASGDNNDTIGSGGWGGDIIASGDNNDTIGSGGWGGDIIAQ